MLAKPLCTEVNIEPLFNYMTLVVKTKPKGILLSPGIVYLALKGGSKIEPENLGLLTVFVIPLPTSSNIKICVLGATDKN